MSILNRPSDGLLSVLLALRRALIAYGPQPEARLLELCAPDSDALSDPGMARRTLTRWKQLGLFADKDNDGVISLSPVAKKIGPDELAGLRAALLQLVLAVENNPTLVSDRDGDEEARAEKSKASDFSLAASWALAQDLYSFPRSFPDVEAMLSEQRVSLRLFQNSTRWNGFAEWAAFLGVGYKASKMGLVLNPHFAVASVLDDVFGAVSELSQEAFLSRLASALPIVDGGSYRQITDEATGQPWITLPPKRISPCLSAALQTLAEKSILRLEPRSDATQCVLVGRSGRDGYTFSHVVRLKTSNAEA